MDTITAIMTRRSVRTFTDEDVSDEVLEQLLRAGMQAPSAGNAQPWEFVVLRDRALLEEVAKINEYAAFAPKAALGILVCANLTLEKFPGYWWRTQRLLFKISCSLPTVSRSALSGQASIPQKIASQQCAPSSMRQNT